MDERINSVIEEMSKTAADALETFGGLSGEQLNWKPADKSWSVGQCLEHIILTNDQFRPEFERLAAGTRSNSFWENWSPFTGFFGRFLIKAVTEDSKKAKAPSKTIVPPSDIDAGIVQTFCEHIDDVNDRIEKVAGADRTKTVLTSPFLAVFTYSLEDAYTVLVEHTKRHIRQAKRVTAGDRFPASTGKATHA